MFKILIGIVAAAIVTICVFMFIDPSITNTATETAQSVLTSSASVAGFSVTVEGEVSKPGTYTLKEGADMQDLIDAAGGLSDYADELAFFASAELTKGKTYYIASKYDTTNVCSVNELTKVNINEDSADEITTISAFTASVASSIVSYRTEHGEFHTIEDLLEVYGIGNATYRKVRNYVTLHA